jgi:hypothetical protein
VRRLPALLFVVVLALGLPAAAAPGPEDKALETTPYYPLKVGNTWTYKSGTETITVTVAKLEEIDKQMSARIEASGGSIKGPLSENIVIKADGIFRVAAVDKKVEPPVKLLGLPPKKGDSWKIDAKIGSEKLEGKFESGEVDEVKVPAGTYKNVVTVTGSDIDANGVKMSMTYYFAKEVGMVKQSLKIAGQEIVLELEKFEPGK